MTKEQLLEKALREYPIGTYILNDKKIPFLIQEKLYWQYSHYISHEGIPTVYDSYDDRWATKCDKNGNV